MTAPRAKVVFERDDGVADSPGPDTALISLGSRPSVLDSVQTPKALLPLASGARRCLLLSGTPVLSRPIEIFTQAHALRQRPHPRVLRARARVVARPALARTRAHPRARAGKPALRARAHKCARMGARARRGAKSAHQQAHNIHVQVPLSLLWM